MGITVIDKTQDDQGAMLLRYTKWLLKKQYLQEGLNTTRLVSNYLLGKDKVAVNVKDRPKIVREISKANSMISCLEKQLEIIVQHRIDMADELREIETFIEGVEQDKEVEKNGN